MSTPERICSLLPSATEIVAGLGLAGRLVGVSAECDWPPSVRGVPVVTRARVDTAALASRAVDDAVRAALADGRSLYAVDEALLGRLAPDVVLTQDLCAVCAVSAGEVRSAACYAGETVSLDPRTLEAIARSVEELAGRLGVPARGREVAGRMRERIARVRAAVAGRPRPRVFLAEWLDPPFAPGHWLAEMVEAAGGEAVLGRPGEPAVPTTWDAVAAAAPALVVAAPCGLGLDRTVAEARASVPALGCPVVAVDGNALYARPAPRVADGVEQLAHLLHPDAVADPGLPSETVGP